MKILALAFVALTLSVLLVADSSQAMSGLPGVSPPSASNRDPGSNGRLSIVLTQKNLTVVRGSTFTVGVSVGPTSGRPSQVHLSAQGAPTGTHVSFNPETGRVPFMSMITIETSNVTRLGEYSLTVIATMGGLEASTTLFVLVIPLIHNIAVVSAEAPTSATIGQLVSVNTTVADFGSVSESFGLQLRVNESIVDELFPIMLTSLAYYTTTLHWNTTGFAPGSYSIVVMVLPVLGELDLSNNSFRVGQVILMPVPSANPPTPSSPPPSPSKVSFTNQNYGREFAIVAAVIESVLVLLAFLRKPAGRLIRKRK